MTTSDVNNPAGLGGTAASDWPSVGGVQSAEPWLTQLADPEKHKRVLDYCLSRLTLSERKMSNFYARWRVSEAKVQAYIDLPDWEKQLKEMNNNREAPKVVSIQVPYTFATIATIVTYMMHTFTGRQPIFQIRANKSEAVESAAKMEMVLQYNADHIRLIKHLFQMFNDGETYGVGVLRTAWKKTTAMRTIWRNEPKFSAFGMSFGEKKIKTREPRTTYEGNDVAAIDPFLFFPDPRVPMHEVSSKGEFVFWRDFQGKHALLRAQADGKLKYVEKATTTMPRADRTQEESARSLLAGGDATPGVRPELSSDKNQEPFYQVDQGSIEIIPAELGLGESKTPVKMLVTILNKNQIVQAEPLDNDHGKHPVAVIEPYTMGYGFGQPGMADYLGPLQDTISWFVNSHIYNVRTALNNMFVVDPSMVEIQDLKNPEAGKLIRLKRAAQGQDVRTVLHQLQVHDVTASHMGDLQTFVKMGDTLSSVVDNLRGIQDSGSRKSATEARQSMDAAASRLAAHCKLVSSQGIVDLTEQMSLNIQQYMSEEFYLEIVGEAGRMAPIQIGPEALVGDFHYPVNDGTLPMDRIAMLDVWKEIFMAVAQDQQLRQEFNVTGIFEFVAELGGAKNIDKFKVQVQPVPNAQLEQQAQAGNSVPVPGGIGPSGLIQALGPQGAGARAAGGLG